ncbi:VWA domain-containing protein [Prolixibacteraceae bacterium JC049]|nr:VWA domain-containing protein [Prolixibacteraceae bacterium JC049]
MSKYIFANPEYLYLLFILVPMLGVYIWRHRKLSASLQISTIKGLENIPITFRHVLRHFVFVLKMAVVGLLIVALARPQSSESWQNVTTEGIDVVIALDVSSSMLARDFVPDRLSAAQNVAVEFISGRRNDKIGLVVFSGESFTQCPLTTDHAVLINLFKDIDMFKDPQRRPIEDGTAIGNGLAQAVARLKDSNAKSKVVILLTDGENNKGEIAPKTAAELAKTFGIRVYTIGVGTIGTAPYPIQVQSPFGGVQTQIRDVEVKIDEETLEQIAETTGGRYFRATDNEKLKEIYTEIDKLEKTKIEVKEFSKRDEEFQRFAIPALLIFGLALLIQAVFLRSIP